MHAMVLWPYNKHGSEVLVGHRRNCCCVAVRCINSQRCCSFRGDVGLTLTARRFEGKEDKEFHNCKAYKAAMQVEQARIEFLGRSAGGGGSGAPPMVMPQQQLPPQHTAPASLAQTQMVQMVQAAQPVQIQPQPQNHVENPMSNEGAQNAQDFLVKRIDARQKVEAPGVEDPDSDPWRDAGLPPNSSSGQSDV